ncbi:MAG: hypothetical protein GF331_01545 [Chitinivibrionales bacterium]|nr:hypothetical protein [Chitinivibrionales bacterium]
MVRHSRKMRYHLRTSVSGLRRRYGTRTVPSGVWSFVSLTYDGTMCEARVDLALDTSFAASGYVRSSQEHRLGHGYIPSAEEYWVGGIDDIRIYNRALSVAELQVLYREGGYRP